MNPLQWRIVKELTSTRAVSVYFGDVEQSIFSFLGASASTFASAVADCERHYFKTNFRATPILLEILMRFSLDALRSEWEFLPAPSDVTCANGEVSLLPSGSPKTILEEVQHLLDEDIAENVAILVRTEPVRMLSHGLYRVLSSPCARRRPFVRLAASMGGACEGKWRGTVSDGTG